MESRGWHVDAVGILPLQNNFSALARIGAFRSTTRGVDTLTLFGSTLSSRSVKEREINPKLGLGVQYDFTPLVGIRAEWDHFRKVGEQRTTGEGNFNLFSVGLLIKLQ